MPKTDISDTRVTTGIRLLFLTAAMALKLNHTSSTNRHIMINIAKGNKPVITTPLSTPYIAQALNL